MSQRTNANRTQASHKMTENQSPTFLLSYTNLTFVLLRRFLPPANEVSQVSRYIQMSVSPPWVSVWLPRLTPCNGNEMGDYACLLGGHALDCSWGVQGLFMVKSKRLF